MELLIVHLTDIHIKDDEDFEILLERTTSIGGAICTHITEPDQTEILFCITGDFVYEGIKNQYVAVGMILEEICLIIKTRFPKISIHPIFVPGNHDCDFNDSVASMRETLLASPKLDVKDNRQMEVCTSVQKEFFVFCEEWSEKYGAMSCKNDKILTINELHFEKENTCIKFHCINTSWCSKKHEEKGKMKITTGKMQIPSDILPEKENDDIVITLMHHSAEWLEWEDVDIWNDYHKRYSDIILVGHDHRAECVHKINYDKSTNEIIMGNQLYDKETPNQSGFNILKIKLSEKTIQECFFTYEWNGNIYEKRIDTGYRPFTRNRFIGSGIKLKEEVLNYIEDMGFDIKSKGKRALKLSDVFGFPTLKEEKKKSPRIFRDMPNLISYIELKKYVSIRGQKEYGKTALLKQLFKYFYENKKFPVFLDVSNVNTADGEALNRLIGQKYIETYDNVTADTMLQKSKEEIVCIIDNFEEIRLSDKSAKKFLQFLTNKFGVVIISRNHKLDLVNPLSYVELNDFIKTMFSTLEIQPARRSYMDRIITRWLCLEEDMDVDSVEFDAKRKAKYTEIGNVMKGNYFNGTPIDLLLVLSYLEQEHPTQIDYSRYSFIYDSLILSKLNSIGDNEAQTISAYKKILQSIAYKMYKDAEEEYVDEAYIISVILDYKEKHSGFSKKTGDILQRLIDYSFLECKNDTYRFKHGYMYYYFAGSYIDKNLSRVEREEVIKDIFFNMDIELNYNVALFLSHNMSIEHDILPVIKELEEKLLVEYENFQYEDIKTLIEEWGGDIETRVEDIFTVPNNENIPVLREERIRKQEEEEIKREEIEEREEREERVDDNVPTDDDVRKINADVLRIGRLVDYMGTVLKNYSGGMEDIPREEMIDLMFKSANKTIGAFFGFSKYSGTKLIEFFDEKIKEGTEDIKEGKREIISLVKEMFAEVWTQFVSANITGLAACLECDSLKENVANYCMRNNTDFVKMTRVEFLLRIANTRLPVREIEELYNGRDSLEDISKLIMKYNIYRYLSSYQFNDNDRRVVCSTLGFNIKDVLIEEKKLQMLLEK